MYSAFGNGRSVSILGPYYCHISRTKLEISCRLLRGQGTVAILIIRTGPITDFPRRFPPDSFTGINRYVNVYIPPVGFQQLSFTGFAGRMNVVHSQFSVTDRGYTLRQT